VETDLKVHEKKGIIDSDDEYRNSETFLQDRLIGNKDISTKSGVIEYLETFVSLSKSADEYKVRNELETILLKCIADTKNEIARRKFQTIKSVNQCTLDHEVFDDWLNNHTKSNNVDGKGSKLWVN